MSQDTASAPIAARIEQSTWDILARGWRENRTCYEVLTALGVSLTGEGHVRWLGFWGAARPRYPGSVKTSHRGPSGYGGSTGSSFTIAHLGIEIRVDGVNVHPQVGKSPGDPRWLVYDRTSPARAGPYQQ